jgi:hypothetical protein
MWALQKTSAHRGHWRTAHAYRSAGERASTVLWWTVIASTIIAAISYAIYLFQ